MKLPDISVEVWDNNYRGPTENTVDDTWERAAKTCSSIEKEDIRQKVYEDFKWLLTDFRGVSGGRITANIGIESRKATTMYNCFVHHPGDLNYKDPDSIDGIYDMLKAQAHTLKSEGGYGTNFSWLRPAGSYIKGIGGRTPGVLKFMELWDKSSEIITIGSEDLVDNRKEEEKKKIRKGAQMGVLSIWHPEIEEFIDAKLTPNRLTKFNLSVGVTQGFMEAMLTNQKWDLKFPDTTCDEYKTEWNGDIYSWERKNLPVVIYKTVNALELWNKITHATYTRNEPGVLFLDICNELNPLYYAENILATNPCFSGDTLIAVADGRNAVSIKQLADEGKDVPVYSMNKKTGMVEIKMGRNPRVTGYNKKLLRIHLSNDQFVDVTLNHKFILSDGSYKLASDLIVGDRIPSSNRLQDNTITTTIITTKQSRSDFLEKKCEICGKLFSVNHSNREICFCSNECANIYENNLLNTLVKTCEGYEKISKIEEIPGTHTVYNITVEDNHTVALVIKQINNNLGEHDTYLHVCNCGEIGMALGVCLLFSLNLVKYIKQSGDNYEFDYEMFKKAVKIAVRFADNINDISRVPIKDYEKAIIEKRRIGVGTLSLGSLHYILGIKFGSKESLELIENIFRTKCETELLASAELGAEKGNFLLFDKDKYFSSKWWNTLPISESIKNQIKEIGCMRNSHHAANAPTGNMGVYVGVVSNGIEPVYNREYDRWVTVSEFERNILRNSGFKFPDVSKGEWYSTDTMKFAKLGTEEVLLGTFNGNDYQVDKNRGLTKKNHVQDYGWRFVKEHFSKEKFDRLNEQGVFVTTEELSVDDHINTLSIIAKYINMNSSKTVNIKNDYPYEAFKDLYLKAWDSKIKGITSYRAGTMTAVLEKSGANKESVTGIEYSYPPKRPLELPCDIKKSKIDGEAWTIFVGLINGQPYEIFGGLSKYIDIPNKYKSGKIVKNGKNSEGITAYNLIVGEDDDQMILKDIANIFENKSYGAFTRILSLSLRHGSPIQFVVEQLQKDKNSAMTSFSKVMARVLKTYIKDGTKSTSDKICPNCKTEGSIIYQEGCMLCQQCSYSKCG